MIKLFMLFYFILGFVIEDYCRFLGFSIEGYFRDFSLKTILFIHSNFNFWVVHVVKMNKVVGFLKWLVRVLH